MMDEAKQAGEDALAMVEMEKQKCRAAMETAQMAQRIAELEFQKRKNAERKAEQEAEEMRKMMGALTRTDLRYRKYTIEDIEIATNNFSDSAKIGEGGYGPVYKGFLDHTVVAIKVLRPNISQGLEQFQREVDSGISSIRCVLCHLLCCFGFLIRIALCCCFPCIIAILYVVIGQEGASDADISILPKYRFQICTDEDKPTIGAGRIVPIATSSGELASERIVIPEDAFC